MILFLALLMASDAELPIEAAVKLREYRKLPAQISAPAMLTLIPNHELVGNAAKEIAKEAYGVAMRVDRFIDLKEYATEIGTAEGMETIAAAAWKEYMKYRDPLVDPVLAFPPRSRTKAARCDHRMVDSAYDYLQAAFRAGRFEEATESLRSSVELGEAVKVITDIKDGWLGTVGIKLIERLSLANDSRREFEEFLKDKSLQASVFKLIASLPDEERVPVESKYQQFLSENQRKEACAPLSDLEHEFDPVEFRRMKQQFMSKRWNDASGYEMLQRFVALYDAAELDEDLLDELEFSGDQLLGILTKWLREGMHSHRPHVTVPPPPPPPKR